MLTDVESRYSVVENVVLAFVTAKKKKLRQLKQGTE